MGEKHTPKEIRIIFDGSPGPTAGRFVEVENELGRSIKFGEWHEDRDGFWSLRFPNNHERLVEFVNFVAGMKTVDEADEAAASESVSDDIMRPVATTVLEWIARDTVIARARALLAEIDHG